jgi:hypothetical protein
MGLVCAILLERVATFLATSIDRMSVCVLHWPSCVAALAWMPRKRPEWCHSFCLGERCQRDGAHSSRDGVGTRQTKSIGAECTVRAAQRFRGRDGWNPMRATQLGRPRIATLSTSTCGDAAHARATKHAMWDPPTSRKSRPGARSRVVCDCPRVPARLLACWREPQWYRLGHPELHVNELSSQMNSALDVLLRRECGANMMLAHHHHLRSAIHVDQCRE